MTPFACTHCRQTVFFENTACQGCGFELGFWPARRRMVTLQPVAGGAARRTVLGRGTAAPVLRACANRTRYQACNWMLDVDDEHALCPSCRLNGTIPNLAEPDHLDRWRRVERAKRRLCHTLLGLGLMPEPRRGPDDAQGLCIDVLAPVDGKPVTTGHAQGVVTLNLMEADDLHRESARVAFGEPWRTVLGHLRHEVAHYLHHRWIAPDAAATQSWRAAFGDERADYHQALARHHAEGPPPQWNERCISAYASAHPHEDWAETCAHVLLVMDAVETAKAWGLTLSSRAARAELRRATPEAAPIDELVVGQWLPVAQFLNAMNRSLGLPDSYPFQMPAPVVHKMAVAAQLLRRAARRQPATVPAA